MNELRKHHLLTMQLHSDVTSPQLIGMQVQYHQSVVRFSQKPHQGLERLRQSRLQTTQIRVRQSLHSP